MAIDRAKSACHDDEGARSQSSGVVASQYIPSEKISISVRVRGWDPRRLTGSINTQRFPNDQTTSNTKTKRYHLEQTSATSYGDSKGEHTGTRFVRTKKTAIARLRARPSEVGFCGCFVGSGGGNPSVFIVCSTSEIVCAMMEGRWQGRGGSGGREWDMVKCPRGYTAVILAVGAKRDWSGLWRTVAVTASLSSLHGAESRVKRKALLYLNLKGP